MTAQGRVVAKVLSVGELVALGETGEVMLCGRAKCCDRNPDASHIHLLRDGCDRARCPSVRHTYAISHVELVFRGLCPNSAAAPRWFLDC